jgi:DNA invertase Pin-like site-specific DNA recombinase
MKTPPQTPTGTGISYVRFSSPEQRRGDSLRRQTEDAAAWCEKNGIPLDTSLTLHDRGCSAYKGLHRENPDKHALALFLKLVERGRVRPGDFLIIENLDRLSREQEVPACHLLTSILVAGVKVVQLSPYEMVLTDKSNGWELMRAVMELSRGHGESAIKSERVAKARKKRLERTRAGEVVLTRNLPAWVEERGGQLHLIPERAEAVRRIFQLAAAGYGGVRIVKALVAEGVRPFGDFELCEEKDAATGEVVRDEKGEPVLRRKAPTGARLGCGRWIKAYVSLILSDRRAVGEFQPEKDDGSPNGPPLPAYYPPVVTPEQWDAARAGACRRRAPNGQALNNGTKHVDIFAGLIKDARDGGAIFSISRGPKGRLSRSLINQNGREGRAPTVTFPYATFERGVCSLLKEIPAAEVLGVDDAPAAVATLSAELARADAEYAEACGWPMSRALAERLAQMEAHQADLRARLAEANRAAAHPAAEAWGEAQGLMDAIDGAADPDDVRIRLRTALRRTVEEIRVLFVARKMVRLCAAQVFFAGGAKGKGNACRSYLILHQHATRGAVGERPESWWARSLASVIKSDDLDLRRREDAAELERTLVAAAQADPGPGQPPCRRRQ